ncbi:MAG: hypothetical protein HOK28_14755 [Deltaproteobacteria bacterium]|nr:hypothetical protein [Deltaproteobacteria bacterium]
MSQAALVVRVFALVVWFCVSGCSSEAVVPSGTDETVTDETVAQPDPDTDTEDTSPDTPDASDGSDASDPSNTTDVPDDETPEPAAEPDNWMASGTQDETAFAWGLQISDTTSESAMLSVRTRESVVDVKVLMLKNGEWEDTLIADDQAVVDSVFQMEITDLEPDSLYFIAIYSADQTRRSRVTRFRSALAADASRILRFGATSCLGGQNRPFPTLTRAAEEKLDFFLMAGDTVYADTSLTFGSYRNAWEDALSQQGLRDLFASTSVIATWDDHEVTNNWSWEDFLIEDRFAWAREAWSESIPWREGPGGTGIWRRLNWGKVVDVLVMDTRGERYDGDYISIAQMDWLKAWLSESDSKFKVILHGVPITDMDGIYGPISEDDRWDGYQHQRSELLEHIEDNDIQGVLWVSGDFHFSALAKVDKPGGPGANQWEVFAGPAGSFVNPIVYIAQENDQYKHIYKTYTYTYFEADPDAGTMRVKFINDDGNVLTEDVLQLVE